MAKIDFRNTCFFLYEMQAYAGVHRIANLVRQDVNLVTGFYPGEYISGQKCKNLVIYGTAGKSPMLDRLEQKGILDLSDVRGKREVYSFQVVDKPLEGIDHALIVAGSDKRGTIYGLFHLSELLGVSPLVNWNHVIPQKKKNVSLTDSVNIVSKEPSVRYRGFFINDEWPAFGTWAQKHFGGVNSKCYERVFELLLRLKGNYLWPAMWKTNFSLDGSGLESARLADELGVVMSTSHHEPCMRSGEEYTLVRGKDSIYGDAWDFRANEAGITRFWRDGLLRNKPFENVITMGMRGERDSAILGKEATLKDNIDLLRDVLRTQNNLIRQTINEDLSQVPRQIVLFTEVEEFFYGNEQTKGLMGDSELDGVTIMFSDNNHGYTRTLPTKEMLDHPGGYGLYYHLDMHGGPYAYEWIGANYLPTIWEELTTAYDFGIRDIWVANVGDIGTQELGLSYFLDLAYDIDKWGGADSHITQQYVKKWTDTQFSYLTPSGRSMAESLIWAYSDLLEKRKHEVMNVDVYHPLHFGEAQMVLDTSEKILNECKKLRKKCEEKDLSSFVSLLYYPACGTANVMKLWILAGRNKLFAEQNRIEANDLGEQVAECIKADAEIVADYHSVDNGYYDGFGLSEHIGFVNWNDEDCRYPLRYTVFPANKPRMLISRHDDERYVTGLVWCDHPQVWRDACRPDVNSIEFDIFNGSDKPFDYTITTDCSWISFSRKSGTVTRRDRITLTIDRALFTSKASGSFTVDSGDYGTAVIGVEAENIDVQPNIYLARDGYVAMEAAHYIGKKDSDQGAYKLLEPYGRSGSAMKVFPSTADFKDAKAGDRPYLEYRFEMERECSCELTLMMAPSTPATFRGGQYTGYSVNDGELVIANTVLHPEIPFFLSDQWFAEARNNVKIFQADIDCRKGINSLKLYGMSPAMIFERIIIREKDREIPASYLGPAESYIKWEEPLWEKNLNSQFT